MQYGRFRPQFQHFPGNDDLPGKPLKLSNERIISVSALGLEL